MLLWRLNLNPVLSAHQCSCKLVLLAHVGTPELLAPALFVFATKESKPNAEPH